MKKIILIQRWLLLIAGFLLSIFLSGQSIKAENTTFMIKPELPFDNLVGQRSSYFDLNMVANNERQIKVQVFNPTSQPLTIQARIVDAQTKLNGQVTYVAPDKIDQRLLPQPGSQLLTVPRQIRLEPNQTKSVPITIAAVSSIFSGVKASAVNLYVDQNNQTAAVNNRFLYTVGILLNGKKVAVDQLQKLALGQVKVSHKKQPKIAIQLTNRDPLLLKNTAVKVKLQNQTLGFISYQKQRTTMKLAPKSRFTYDVPLNGKRLVAGAYRVTMTVKTERYRQTFQRYLRIKHGQASWISAREFHFLSNRINYLLILISTILVAAVVIIIIKKRRRPHA